MTDPSTAMLTIFTEFYFFLTIVLMFFIHIGFCMYEVGVARTKNVQHTLLKNAMAIPVVGLAFFLFGMWIYISLQQWPFNPAVSFSTGFEPWSEKLAPNLSDRISGVFWAAFALFGMTAASIVSGSIIERSKTVGFLILAVYVGAIAWVFPAAWGWSGNGWMTQYLGFHDQYCSAVLHSVSGFAALGILINLGPRIGKFGPDGAPREIPAHNPWMVTIGLFMIYVGFFGFYAACHIPLANIAAEGQPAYWTATNIYGFPITLSGVTMNFLLALFAGMMTAYMVSGGNAFWTFSGGLTGLISASAGNDLYHPVLAFAIAVVGTVMAYYLHNWVEKTFKLDDAVGAVAVHGYCGVFGGIVAGFALWGYPAIYPSAGTLVAVSEGAGWFGVNAEGLPIVTPMGNTICSLIFAIGFGFIPGYVLSGILKMFGLLRVDPKVELTGLDGEASSTTYPNLSGAEAAFEKLQLKEGRSKV